MVSPALGVVVTTCVRTVLRRFCLRIMQQIRTQKKTGHPIQRSMATIGRIIAAARFAAEEYRGHNHPHKHHDINRWHIEAGKGWHEWKFKEGVSMDGHKRWLNITLSIIYGEKWTVTIGGCIYNIEGLSMSI